MNNVNKYLTKVLKDNDTVVIGVSGGPDSMALLYLLMNLEKKVNIICAHINHNVRKESAAEYKYVENFCKENKIIFEGMKIERYQESNFENEARTIRYDFFDKLIKKYNAKYLFTAHHADDLMETILMRLVRGSSLKGYAGFEKERSMNNYKVIRPLIEVTKEELIDYCNKNDIKYALDNTNEEDIHTRNRFRKYVVPSLKKEDKNVHTKFLKFSETLLETNDYIEKIVDKSYNLIIKNQTLNIELLKKEDKLIQKKIIYKLLENIYLKDICNIKDIHILNIISLMENNKTNDQISLPNNIIVIKSYNNLEFEKNKESLTYEYRLDKDTKLPNNKEIIFLNNSDETSNNICYLDSKEIKLPLIVRTRKEKDTIEVLGLNGTKSVSDILTNSKVKKQDRNLIPIVLDSNNNIVWVPGIKKSKFDKTKTKKYDIILKYR